jgi:integrase
MAGIRKKGDAFYCTFRFQGERYNFTVGKVSEEQAKAKGLEVDETLGLLERGRLAVPEGVSLVDFVAAGGKAPVISARPDTTTAKDLIDKYVETHGNGTIEANSLRTAQGHLKQVVRTLGEKFKIQRLSLQDLQDHVNRRQKKGVAPVTLRKELATLRACWNWAVQGGLLKGTFPGKGLRFQKEEEKEPFRTFKEIESILASRALDSKVEASLWESLYLTTAEIEEFIAYVQQNGTLPWVYPLVAFAAYTGARRSEMLRALLTDLDLEAGVVTIREKKRVRGKTSSRTVNIGSRLAGILRDWLAIRPDCPFLFCQAQQVARSKTQRSGPTPITKDEAHDHFRRTVEDSKWEVLRGYHVLRHSFISALASKGVDQRIIDDFVGHQSEEQRKRYRHLYPSVKKEALSRVFG